IVKRCLDTARYPTRVVRRKGARRSGGKESGTGIAARRPVPNGVGGRPDQEARDGGRRSTVAFPYYSRAIRGCADGARRLRPISRPVCVKLLVGRLGPGESR